MKKNEKMLEDKVEQDVVTSVHIDSMQALSKVTGVSRVTISKVINGRKGVKEETRKKIMDAIEKYDFHPNTAARNLVQKKNNRIGIILIGQVGWALPSFVSWYFQQYLQGILYQAEQLGTNIMLYREKENQDIGTLVRTREVDGVILVGTSITKSHVEPLVKRGINYVILGSAPSEYNTNSVGYDNMWGASMAANHLLSMGHRNVMCMRSGTDYQGEYINHRFQGVVKAFQNQGVELLGSMTEPFGVEKIKKILAAGIKPTAFLSLDNVVNSLNIIHSCGLSIDENTALIGFDDLPETTLITPTLSVIKQPLYELGALAVQKLFETMNGNSIIFGNVCLPMELIIRQSSSNPVATGNL